MNDIELLAAARALADELERADAPAGKDGAPGPRGEKGNDGRDGQDGRDAVIVPAEAEFERDHYKLTTRVVVRAADTDEVLLTITPHRNGNEPMHSATIAIG